MIRTAFVLRLVAWAAGGFVVGFILSHSLYALTPPRLDSARAAIEPQSSSAGHRFASDAGIMLKFIKPDKTGDFEATVDKLRGGTRAKQQSRAPATGPKLASLQGSRTCDQRRRRVRV